MTNTSEFANSGHGYSESGLFDEQAYNRAKKEAIEPSLESLALDALRDLIKLHHREQEGDESITMKEWNKAINHGIIILEISTIKP